MILYAKGSPTTMKLTITVLDLDSLPMVIDKVVVPRSEIESLVKPVRAEAMGARSFLVKSSF